MFFFDLHMWHLKIIPAKYPGKTYQNPQNIREKHTINFGKKNKKGGKTPRPRFSFRQALKLEKKIIVCINKAGWFTAESRCFKAEGYGNHVSYMIQLNDMNIIYVNVNMQLNIWEYDWLKMDVYIYPYIFTHLDILDIWYMHIFFRKSTENTKV